MLKIAYTHPLDEEKRQQLLACGEVELVDGVTERQTLMEVEGVEVMYGHPRKEEFDRFTQLKWVHMMNTGGERLLQWCDGRDGVVVTCVRGHSAVQMSEHVLAGLLYLSRDFPAFVEGNREGNWKPEYQPVNLEGSRVLVLGVGGIGKAVAAKLKGLGVKVRGVNYSGQAVDECDEMFTLETIGEHLSDVDHVVNCLPHSEQTRGFIGKEFLGKLLPGAGVVNISRGAVIDEDALLEAIDSGQVRGAVLDVTWPEPPVEGSRLYEHPQVLVTGHLSWKPSSDGQMGFELFARNLKRYLHGDIKNFESVVDRERGY